MTSVSVFATHREEMFHYNRVKIRFRDRLVGGQPKDPKLVVGWIGKNVGITDEVEMAAKARQHLVEMGVEIGADVVTLDDLFEVAEREAEMKTQGFKRDPLGRPYIEARHVKACIKECVNILYAGVKWGTTRKGPRSYTAERVFVDPDVIVVGAAEDVFVEQSIGHITGPQGPRSTIGLFEYVTGAEVEFVVRELRSQTTAGQEPALTYDQWARVWTLAQENGLGTMRSQGHGQFDVIEYEREDDVPAKKKTR